MIGTVLALGLMAYDHGAELLISADARLRLAARHPRRAARAWGRVLTLALVSPSGAPWVLR